MTLNHIAAGERDHHQVEYLVIRGFLTVDLKFHNLASHSTFSMTPTSRRPTGEYVAELQDDNGNPLNRQPIDVFDPVVCYNQQSNIQSVYGSIALRNKATRLLLFKKDILLDQRPVLKPPSLALAWKVKKADRKKAYSLTLKYSESSPGAYIQVFYQWGESAYQSLGLYAPKKKINIRFAKRPGGKTCRLIVAYTNGMRTAVAKTPEFSVPQRDPMIRIISPEKNVRVKPKQPITLIAQISRLGGLKSTKNDLVWHLKDEIVGKGNVVTLAELPPGKHELVLRWHQNPKIAERRTIRVLRS